MAASYLKFKSLELRNFLSVGNQMQELPLDGGDSVLVIGRNYDAPNGLVGGNGCGKCVVSDTIITVRNKYNGKVESLTIGELHGRAKANDNTAPHGGTFNKS